MESELLTRSTLARMIDAKGAKEAFSVLSELPYAKHMDGIKDVKNFQVVLDSGMQEAKQILISISPHKELLDILWWRYDIQNLKVFLKALIKDTSVDSLDPALSSLGKYDRILIKHLVFHNKSGPIDREIITAFQEAKQLYEKTKNIQMIDLTLDKAYFRMALHRAETIGESFLTEFLQKSIDISNVKMLVRLHLLKKPELIRESFITGGTLSRSRFEESHLSGLEGTTFKEIAEEASTSNSVLRFEKMLEEEISKFILQSKTIVAGPEPLIAYFWARRNNAKILRTVLIAKINGIHPEKIWNMILELYD